jgi:uncharacterized protein (TIGR02452 family)
MSILDLRKKIWFENRENCENYIPTEKSTKYVYDVNFEYPSKSVKSNVIVVKKDSIVASYDYDDPLIVSFADDLIPGGCVNADCGNQEESIFRRTTIQKHLPYNMYPIKECEAIYSPLVNIIYDSEDLLYKKLNPIIKSNFVSCPGLKFPKLDITNKIINRDDTELLRKKIELIFQVCISNNHKTLILGPIGCGAYGTPMIHTAEIFKQVIKLKIKSSIENIVFACLGSSYNIFNAVLSEL